MTDSKQDMHKVTTSY